MEGRSSIVCNGSSREERRDVVGFFAFCELLPDPVKVSVGLFPSSIASRVDFNSHRESQA